MPTRGPQSRARGQARKNTHMVAAYTTAEAPSELKALQKRRLSEMQQTLATKPAGLPGVGWERLRDGQDLLAGSSSKQISTGNQATITYLFAYMYFLEKAAVIL